MEGDTMSNRSHLEVHVLEFGLDATIPLGYPVDVTLADLKKVATTMLEEGKAREAKVINTSSGATLFEGRWTLTVDENGIRA